MRKELPALLKPEKAEGEEVEEGEAEEEEGEGEEKEEGEDEEEREEREDAAVMDEIAEFRELLSTKKKQRLKALKKRREKVTTIGAQNGRTHHYVTWST